MDDLSTVIPVGSFTGSDITVYVIGSKNSSGKSISICSSTEFLTSFANWTNLFATSYLKIKY